MHQHQDEHHEEEVRILWKTLKRVCEEMCGKPVEIMLTTELSGSLNSATIFNDNEVTILLNALYCKGEGMVIMGVAHEIAHVLDNNNVDNNSWEKLREMAYQKIQDEYNMAIIRTGGRG